MVTQQKKLSYALGGLSFSLEEKLLFLFLQGKHF